MPVTITGLGKVLGAWRGSQNCTIPEWARLLKVGGLSGTEAEIADFLTAAEGSDLWTRPYSLDGFDDFLETLKQTVYDPSRDTKRWKALSTLFVRHRIRCAGFPIQIVP